MPKGKPKKTDGPKKPAKVVKKTFKLHKIQYDFHHCNELYRGFVGGVGCLSAYALIGGVPVGELNSTGECRTLLGDALRSPSFVKGRDDLYRVTMGSGRRVSVTLGHRFLSPEGWLPLSKLRVGSLIAADGSEDADLDREKSINWTDDCFLDSHHDDELPHPVQVFYRGNTQQFSLQTFGGHAIANSTCHPSIVRSSLRLPRLDLASAPCISSCGDESFRGQGKSLLQDQLSIHQQDTFEQFLPSAKRTLSSDYYPCQHEFQTASVSLKRKIGQYQPSLQSCSAQLSLQNTQQTHASINPFDLGLQDSYDHESYQSQEGFDPESLDYSCFLQEGDCEAPSINAFWDTIVDITFERNGEFYDLTVPNLEHYSASGLYHHNSGKSWIGAYDLLKRAMAPEMAGRYLMVVAPTYTLLKDASQRTTIQLAEELGIIKERFKQPPEIILNNGATVIFRSGDEPDKLRGPNLSGIWLDEASLMSEEVWKVAIGRLREGGEAGFITGTFTPQGTNHWTYQKFATNQPNTAFFKSKTKENPFLSKDFVAALEKNYDERTARQELEGEFLTMDGVEWPNQYFGEHIWIDKFPESHDLTISAMSLDPSKGKNARHGDYSTTIRLGRDKAGILYVDADLRRCDSETLIAYFIGEVADFYPDVIGIEVNQFQHLLSGEIAKGMKKHNIDIPIIELYNNIQKEVRIRRLGPYLSNKKFRFVRSPGTNLLVSQLREFPLGKHDDGPDGLEMALRVMISTWNGRMGRKAKRVIA